MIPRIWQKITSRFQRKRSFWDIFKDHEQAYRLPFAILLAILFAILMTTLGVMLYVGTGTSKLDLSRPGYEAARKKLTKDEPNDLAYKLSPTGALSKELLDDYLTKFKKRQQILKSYDAFDPHLIDDSPLNIMPSTVDPISGEPAQ